MRAIDSKQVVTRIFMDLNKAFDVVDHKLLLDVLEKYGVRGDTLELFASYLRNRMQMVKIGDVFSLKATISSGVVGPLLYLIFINAIGSLNLSGKLYLFADNAVLINIHKRSSNIIECM
jgi:hypothetical protein